MYSPSPKTKRVEVRFPDPSANMYLAFSALLMAGLDGIKKKIDPGDAVDKNLYDLESDEAKKIPTLPSDLGEALKHLEQDHQFLLQGGVFSQDLLESWIAYKRDKEVDQVRIRPHPHEFYLYYDV